MLKLQPFPTFTVNKVFYFFVFWVSFWEGFMEMYTNFTVFPSRVNLIFRVESYLGLLTWRKLSKLLDVNKNVQYINFFKTLYLCFFFFKQYRLFES